MKTIKKNYTLVFLRWSSKKEKMKKWISSKICQTLFMFGRKNAHWRHGCGEPCGLEISGFQIWISSCLGWADQKWAINIQWDELRRNPVDAHAYDREHVRRCGCPSTWGHKRCSILSHPVHTRSTGAPDNRRLGQLGQVRFPIYLYNPESFKIRRLQPEPQASAVQSSEGATPPLGKKQSTQGPQANAADSSNAREGLTPGKTYHCQALPM